MPTPRKGKRLGGSPAHQRLILANLATQLFEHGAVRTTETRARVLRPHAEKLITKAKKGDLHNRREVLKTIRDKSVVHTLFTEIGPMFAERPGGYTRITKIGPRKGDNAPMAIIELVTEEYDPSAASSRGNAPSGKVEAPAAEPVDEVDGTEQSAEDEGSELTGTPENPVRVEDADSTEAVDGGEPQGDEAVEGDEGSNLTGTPENPVIVEDESEVSAESGEDKQV